MRIQNNIMAVNAYRNYNNNTGALSKNLEKLSSGYRINRAGDDAAGLAISEKMRAQITGLSAAQKNVKDGVSLVKTAEGAMQEIQDMLGRMDYLATQSANGTYQDEVDRANLQKEVQSLKKEIDRIAESANFNGIKLLNGSLKEETVENAGAAAAAMRLRGGTAAEGTDEGDSINALMRSRLVSRATEAIPAKKAVFTFDFDDLAGEYRRSDWINIRWGSGPFDGRTITFHPDHSAGDINIGYRTGREIADAYRKSFNALALLKDGWEIEGQDFVWSVNGSVLTIEQKNAPVDASELVDGVISVTINRVKPAEITGTPKDDAAFGDKANLEKSADIVYVTKSSSATNLGTIDVSKFDADAVVDYMRANGIKGSTSNRRPDYFYLFYDDVEEAYYLMASESSEIEEKAAFVVTNADGTVDSSSNGLLKAGQTAVLDFGELGQITINATQDHDEECFMGSPNSSLSVIENAQSANGGSIKFQISADQRQKLLDYADALDVRCPDSKNPTPVDIEMQWNTDHFELICGGKVLAKSQARSISDETDIVFSDPRDRQVVFATAAITKAASDSITATAFEGGVATGLQFNVPDTKTLTTTVTEMDFSPGAVEVPGQPDPDPPDPPGPGPDEPDPPDPGPDDPDPPGPDGPDPPGPGPDDPDPPNPPDDPNKPGNRGGKGLILQIGDTSQDYDRMRVFIGDMHTDAMGAGKATLDGREVEITDTVADIDIGTQAGAQDAIAVIKNAINYVSGVRGDLGAYQNRLEHTANNLSVMAENIQDAESTIRDTDVAEEMMGYVKNNILIQSAQAMLAQANQAPQGVLSLLAG